ncbi:MAG: hypothetical protein IAF94_15125 [Pirellulaceae bacterium]|nr:hypothetical protein [Pirellulaceae bacterium]
MGIFDWLRSAPECPCSPPAKAWVEEGLSWLCREFPENIFTGKRLILPTGEFFPEPYHGTDEDVEILLRRVCDYMQVDRSRVVLDLMTGGDKTLLVNEEGHYIASVGGTYEDAGDYAAIHLDVSALEDPIQVVGTLAHELAHHRLMGEQRVTGDEFDNELLTDLTTVALGLGLFLASSPRNWRSQYFKWEGTDFNRPEYMSPLMFGYALAHLAWFENESRPRWAKHIPYEARHSLNASLRYLSATGDSSFTLAALRES